MICEGCGDYFGLLDIKKYYKVGELSNNGIFFDGNLVIFIKIDKK